MTASALLNLKQRLASLRETERRELSAYLIRLGQDAPAWKRETSRRLRQMAAGKQTSTSALRRQLGHA